MGIDVRTIDEPQLKQTITERVLRDLPEWFGIEEAIVEYVQQSQHMMFWAAYVLDRPVGFLALLEHNRYTAEIYCMGIDKHFHHQGLGTSLVNASLADCRNKGREFLTVKTLDQSRPDKSYEKTRQFYLAMGFRPLEVFPTLWDEENPCLFMAKYL